MHAVHFDKTPTSTLPHLNETFIMLSLSCHLCAVHAVLGIENTEQSEKMHFIWKRLVVLLLKLIFSRIFLLLLRETVMQ